MDGFGYPHVMVVIVILVKMINRYKNNILYSILISILHFSMCILLGAVNWYFQFMLVPVISIVTIIICFEFITRNRKLICAILLPFYLIYTISSIYVKSFPTYPIWITGIIVSCLFLYFYKNKTKPSILLGGIICAIVLARYLLMPSYFSFLSIDENVQKYKLENISLVDENGNDIDMKLLRGKILLLDIWNTGCGICIKKFPQLDKLNKKFASDSSINIISLNMPIIRPNDKNLAIKITDRFGFKKIYFKTPFEHNKLSIKAVPMILIFNRDFKCVFASGDLNIEPNVFIGNAENMIIKTKKL